MKEKKTGDYVAAVIMNVVVCIVLNTLLLWRQWTQGVILESWVDIPSRMRTADACAGWRRLQAKLWCFMDELALTSAGLSHRLSFFVKRRCAGVR